MGRTSGHDLGDTFAMDVPIRVTVLGRVAVTVGGAPVEIDRRQARELLGLLVANRGAVLTTAAIVDSLWDDEPPTTATTIIHGHIRRIRGVLGEEAVVHDGDGYRLDLPVDAVDLWSADEAARVGDHKRARTLWDEPPFGSFAERPWALAALTGLGHLAGVASESAPTVEARRVVPVGRFVGRRAELTTVSQALARNRMVTIVGLSGVGKSRLALEVAAKSSDVVHIDIAGSVGPIATRIASGLGLVATGEPEWDRRAVESTIGQLDLLLVLDGCEGDTEDVGTVAETLLAACPGLRILATAPSALGAAYEIVVPLLTFADPGNPRGDAVELLRDRVSLLGMEVTRRDLPRLAEIGERTAGVPLAIELAATEAIFPAGVSAGGDGGDGPPPGRSPAAVLAATVDRVLGRLTAGTSTAAHRLARLPGGFTPTLLADLVEPDVSAPAVLYELRANGLVAPRDARRPWRLGLPDPVRAGLAARPDASATGAVVRVLTALNGQVRPDLAQPVDPGALQTAVAELANVDAVLADLERHGESGSALALATVVAETWGEAGHWTRGGTAIEALVAGVVAAGSAAEPHDGGVVVDPLTWAEAIRARAVVKATYAAFRADSDDLAAAARIAAEHDADALEAHLRFRLSIGAGYGGDLAEGHRQVERLRVVAARVATEYIGTFEGFVEALGQLAAGSAGDAAHTALAVAERLDAVGALSDTARTLRVAGLAWRIAGADDEAATALKRAEALALESRALGTLATIRGDLIDLRHAQGRLDRRMITEARDTVLAVGNLRASGLLGVQLGVLDDDPVVLAHAALDLLAADRVSAALAIAELVARLPSGHPLARSGPRFASGLRRQWGSPLGASEALVVDALCEGHSASEPWSDEIEGELHVLLQGVAHGGDTR